MSETKNFSTLEDLATLKTFLRKDEKGTFAKVGIVTSKSVELHYSAGVSVVVEPKTLPFKVKAADLVYFDAEGTPESVVASKSSVKEPKVAKSTHGTGSTTVRAQAL